MTHVTWLNPEDPIPDGRRVSLTYPTYMTEPAHREWLTEQLAAKLEYAFYTTVTAMTVHIAPDPDDHLHTPRGRYRRVTAIIPKSQP